MASPPSLSHLLHRDPSAPQPRSKLPPPPPAQHQPQPGLGQYQQPSQAQAQPQHLPPSLGTSYSHHYPPPPSEPSPATSGTPHSLATPATSPTSSSVPAPASSNSRAPATNKSHAQNTNLYQCADCLKKYSRPEHLQRHVATHTLGKRFVCDICKKAFARADLLKRHRANHDNDSNGTKRRRINSSPGPGRVAHACQACARARVKCEDSKPCTRCRKRNLTCEYASSEAGSAAAMHLLHLSASAHSQTHPNSPSRLPSHTGTGQQGHIPEPMPAVHTPAAPSNITNLAYTQSNASASPIRTSSLPGKASRSRSVEAASLPTPEDIIEQNVSLEDIPPERTSADFCRRQPSLEVPHVDVTGNEMLTTRQGDRADEYQEQFASNQNMADLSRQQFGEFLSNVLYDQQQRQQQQQQQRQQQQQVEASSTSAPPALAVLDFCDDANLDMNELDFGMLDNWNLGNVNGMLATDPNLANYVSNETNDSADMTHMRQRLLSIWADSPWRWTPDGTKDNIQTEKSNLPLTSGINSSQLQTNKVVNDEMEPSGRDQVLAIVLSACQNNAVMGRVASSFPSTQVMDSLVNVFLAWHLCQVSEFIHFGSFSLNAQCPEWMGVAAAAGAVQVPLKSLRKFGYALQEAVRITIPMKFEENNARIQDLSMVQALVLNHDIGLWSGNRRRMEIAGCHLNIPITMIRGRGVFDWSHYPQIRVDPTDEGAVLEEKWKTWHTKESWKRLVFHLFVRDAQASLTSMTSSHFLNSELTLPLPEARELWFAKTAQEWKMQYIQRHSGSTTRLPSLGHLFHDYNLLATEAHRLDIQFAISIFLHGFWSFIREYHQLASFHRWSNYSPTLGCDPNILLAPRHAEHVKTLEQFQTNFAQNWPHMLFAQENMVLNVLLMNLHVSLEDLRLFSGKAGEERAKRALPELQRWVQTSESRKALWYAGQILRWAREFPAGHLKDFSAVAVHHAALALWTWGVVSRALRASGTLPTTYSQQGEPVLYLDAPESPQLQHFFIYGTGRPAIRGARKTGASGQGVAGGSAYAGGFVSENLVEEPNKCMDTVEEIFRANSRDGHVAPIVENLCHLSKQLGRAAGAVGLG